MAKSRDLLLNTPEEEEAINRGAAEDPDNPELTDDQLRSMRPMREVMPEFVEMMTRRYRGAQKAPVKQLVSIRLDQDVLDGLRAGGAGWQSRANDILRDAISKRER